MRIGAVLALLFACTVGCLRVSTAALQLLCARDAERPALIELGLIARELTLSLAADPTPDALSTHDPFFAVLRSYGGTVRPPDTPVPLPLNPYLDDAAAIERVYAERTGDAHRAAAFARELIRRAEEEKDVSAAVVDALAGTDGPRIDGLIGVEPRINLNLAGASEIRGIADRVPLDGDQRAAVLEVLAAFVAVRGTREIRPPEVAAALDHLSYQAGLTRGQRRTLAALMGTRDVHVVVDVPLGTVRGEEPAGEIRLSSGFVVGMKIGPSSSRRP